MNLIKKNFYKPKYKKFLRLKLNFETTKKLKKKMEKFSKKKKIELYNNSLFFISSAYYNNNYKIYYSNNYINKFRIKLYLKQKISLFYGGLSQKYLKIILKKNTRKKFSKNNKILLLNLLFINLIELRLDTVLYRTGFSSSFRKARQSINHGYILVNKIVVKNSSYILKKGDNITVSKKYIFLIKNFIYIKPLHILSTKHLEINYKTFQIVIVDNLYNYNLSTYYPFWFNLNYFSKYYA